MRGERGSALGYFLVALLGALVGGLMVVALVPRARSVRPSPTPPITPASAMPVSDSAGGSVAEAVRRVGPAVVSINTRMAPITGGNDMPDLFRQFFGGDGSAPPMPRQGQGSGMIIDARKGYILTNAHVVRDAQTIKVTLPDKRSFDGKRIGVDSQSDVAVVQIKADNLPEVRLATGNPPPIGSWVVAIGNPFGFENTVTVGVVSATEREIPRDDGPALERMLQTDAAINPGNSGGPLCNLQGEVVGMNTAILSSAQGIGFAIASGHAQMVAKQLIERGKVIRPYIGVAPVAVTPEMRDYFNLPKNQGGAIIGQVVGQDSPAAKAGLQQGDLIAQIDHVNIKKPEDVRDQVLRHKVGDTLQILVYRGQTPHVFKVKTAEMPQNSR